MTLSAGSGLRAHMLEFYSVGNYSKIFVFLTAFLTFVNGT